MRRPQNLKKSPTCLTKQLFLLSSIKASGRYFQIVVAFSEKLNFTTTMKYLPISSNGHYPLKLPNDHKIHWLTFLFLVIGF